MTTSRAIGTLAEHFDFLLPPAHIVEEFLDQIAFQLWAGVHGFRVPEAELTSDFDGLSLAWERMAGSVIVKPPQWTADWHRENACDEAFPVCTRSDLEQLKWLDGRQMLFQRWGGGRDSRAGSVAFVDGSGVILASKTGRKQRQWPADRGSTAICVTASSPDLTRLTHELSAAARVRGLASLEVMEYDDGSLSVTEPMIGQFRPAIRGHRLCEDGHRVAPYRDAVRPSATLRRARRLLTK